MGRPGPGPGLKISSRNRAGPGRAGLRKPVKLQLVKFAYYGMVAHRGHRDSETKTVFWNWNPILKYERNSENHVRMNI